jgi:hypothetical protein
MKKGITILIIVSLAGLVAACGNMTRKSNADTSNVELSDDVKVVLSELIDESENSGYLKIASDYVEIPWFEIELKLSDKAEEKLKAENETIIVHAEFIHNPDKDDPTRVLDEELLLLSHRIELTDKRLARFEHLKFPKKLYDLLENKDIVLLLIVVSGRKSSLDNFLYCEGLQEPVSKIKGKRITITCKLIRNDD